MDIDLKQLIKMIQIQLNTSYLGSGFMALFFTSLIKSQNVNLSVIARLFCVTIGKGAYFRDRK